MFNHLNRRMPIAAVFLTLLTLDLIYQYSFRNHLPLTSLSIAIIEASFCAAIIFVAIRLDLVKASLCFLALPYLFFIPGWLNIPTAAILATIFVYCFIKTLRLSSSVKQDYISANDLLGFLLVLAWVNLSGAGGYGYQTSDYLIHNARLKDLTEYQWPVRYGDDQNLVYYVGYFLPSAVIGKITSLPIAFSSMYLWTSFGVMLALRWLSQLSGWRFSALLVLIFAFFGPMDILNVITLSFASTTPLTQTIPHILSDNDFLDFRTGKSLTFFIGNYLSNSFQLYWSPQQVIAGWIGIGLITYLFRQKQLGQVIFVYALLCLWAPLVMIALIPFIVVAISIQLTRKWRAIFTVENTLGAASLAIVFVTFYIGGSSSANASIWILSLLSGALQITALLLFFAFAWGLYVIAITPFIRKQEATDRIWFACLVFSFFILPFRTFGEWADLLCRGSAPLMFLLLIYFLQAMRHYWHQQHKKTVLLLFLLLIPGVGSAVLLNYNAITNYGHTQPVASIITYYNAYPNLGPDNTLFERLFRKSLPSITHLNTIPAE